MRQQEVHARRREVGHHLIGEHRVGIDVDGAQHAGEDRGVPGRTEPAQRRATTAQLPLGCPRRVSWERSVPSKLTPTRTSCSSSVSSTGTDSSVPLICSRTVSPVAPGPVPSSRAPRSGATASAMNGVAQQRLPAVQHDLHLAEPMRSRARRSGPRSRRASELRSSAACGASSDPGTRRRSNTCTPGCNGCAV